MFDICTSYIAALKEASSFLFFTALACHPRLWWQGIKAFNRRQIFRPSGRGKAPHVFLPDAIKILQTPIGRHAYSLQNEIAGFIDRVDCLSKPVLQKRVACNSSANCCSIFEPIDLFFCGNTNGSCFGVFSLSRLVVLQDQPARRFNECSASKSSLGVLFDRDVFTTIVIASPARPIRTLKVRSSLLVEICTIPFWSDTGAAF